TSTQDVSTSTTPTDTSEASTTIGSNFSTGGITAGSSSTSTENTDNSAGGTSGSSDVNNAPKIESGDAVALANILNILNTNPVNSVGAIEFSNFFNSINGNVDLRAGTSTACSIFSCGGAEGILVHLLNDAHISNQIDLSAISGNNSMTGSGSIFSGNAYS